MTTSYYYENFLQVGDEVRIVKTQEVGKVISMYRLTMTATVSLPHSREEVCYLDEFEPVVYRTHIHVTKRGEVTLYECPTGQTVCYLPDETMLPLHCIDCGSEMKPVVYVAKSNPDDLTRQLYVDDDGYVSFLDKGGLRGVGIEWFLSEFGWVAGPSDGEGNWVTLEETDEPVELYRTYEYTFPSEDEMGEAANLYEIWLKENPQYATEKENTDS